MNKLHRAKEKDKVCICVSVYVCVCVLRWQAHQLSSRFLQERSQTRAGAAAPGEFLGMTRMSSDENQHIHLLFSFSGCERGGRRQKWTAREGFNSADRVCKQFEGGEKDIKVR